MNADKTDKTDKAGKAEKPGKPEKSGGASPKPGKPDKADKQAPAAAKGEKAARTPRAPEPKTVRLMEHYRQNVRPQLMATGKFANPMALPRIEKVVINMGVGKATAERNRMDSAVRDLGLIAGQRPLVTRARKSVAGFKLRQGQPIGCKVTLRGKRMYEFIDRLISIVLPRVRDFRGLSPKAFDRNGNYTFGLAEQIVFPEIDVDKVEFTQGMDITFAIHTPTPEGAYTLLKLMGMPFQD
jgi:large subunit ribosomal protein L5